MPERDVVPRLVRPDDETVSGDSGYTGMEKREEIKNDPHLSKVIFRVTKRNRYHLKPRAPGFDWDRHIEYQIARTRSKVEYVFLIVKRLFGYRKVRYRGILKTKPTHIPCSLAPICTCWRSQGSARALDVPKMTRLRQLRPSERTALHGLLHLVSFLRSWVLCSAVT